VVKKQRKFLLKMGICLGVVSVVLYQHIEEQNQITALKIALPSAVKELRLLKEKATRLRYEIEQFESPEHLLILANKNEYSHLKYPLAKEVIAMNESSPVLEEDLTAPSRRFSLPITIASHAPMQE